MLPANTAGAPRHDWLTLTGGAIGQGLPAAVGAAIACPDRPVIALEADGSSMYTIQSLWTMAREQLDVTVVIFNNRSYGILNVELARVGAQQGGPKASGPARPVRAGPRFRFDRQRARRPVAARRHRRGARRRPRTGHRRARPAPDRGGDPGRVQPASAASDAARDARARGDAAPDRPGRQAQAVPMSDMAGARWATFDCYGTLVDWNAGIAAELGRLLGESDRDRLLSRYHEVEPRDSERAPHLELPRRDGGGAVRARVRSRGLAR